MKIETNLIEILLREILIDKIIYTETDKEIIVKELNFDPLTNHAFIKDQYGHGYRVSIMDKFKLKSDISIERIEVNKGKLFKN